MKKQDGFGVIGVVIVLVALLAVGGAGYVVYQHQSASTKSSVADTSSQTSDTEETSSEASLAIAEWGVNLKNTVADKMAYGYQGNPGKSVDTGDAYESIVMLGFKESVLQNIGCDASTSILRSKVQPKAADAVKRGDYYYWASGEPRNCDTGSDVQLAKDFTDSFGVSKLELN